VTKTSKRDIAVNIGALTMTVQNAIGHEHRLSPIAQHAASIFAAKLQQRAAQSGARSLTNPSIDSLNASPLNFDLQRMSNDQAAHAIASAWLNAVALRLKF
jgi:hypothetical protein